MTNEGAATLHLTLQCYTVPYHLQPYQVVDIPRGFRAIPYATVPCSRRYCHTSFFTATKLYHNLTISNHTPS